MRKPGVNPLRTEEYIGDKTFVGVFYFDQVIQVGFNLYFGGLAILASRRGRQFVLLNSTRV
jgi:hypothetical protein